MKKNIIIILCIFMIGIIPYITLKVKADSGFDTSYGGSYGGSSSSSSWGSSSSWSSSDYSSSSSSHSYTTHFNGRSSTRTWKQTKLNERKRIIIGTTVGITVGTIAFISIMIIYIKTFREENAKSKALAKYINKNNVSDKIKKDIPDFNEKVFLEERYNDYIKIQEDWMNFNYDGLREKLTDELYNQYEMQLDTLKNKNQKNIMKKFNLYSIKITDYKKQNNQMEISVSLTVSFIDYITEGKKVVRGNKHKPVIITYNLRFVKNINNIIKCPNCGAKILESRCQYCGSTIPNAKANWILSKKQNVRQR